MVTNSWLARSYQKEEGKRKEGEEGKEEEKEGKKRNWMNLNLESKSSLVALE